MPILDDESFGNGSIEWWEEEDPVLRLQAAKNDFRNLGNDTPRLDAYTVYNQLYTNREIDPGSDILSSYAAAWDLEANKYSRVPLNVIKMVIDQVVARVTKSQPKATFLTDKGNFTLKKRSENMEQWVGHIMHSEFFDKKSPLAVRDGCLYGTGNVKVYKKPHENVVAIDRVFPGDVFVDPLETLYGDPLRMFHRMFVSQQRLRKLFPASAGDIDMAGNGISDYGEERSSGFSRSTDQIEVVECWHKPSYEGASDGKRLLFIGTAILEEDPWTEQWFPIETYTWKDDPSIGYYGIGLAEELMGLHLDINTTIRKMERAIELIPNPLVFLEQGSQVSPSEVTNIPGTIIEYVGRPPQVFNPNSVPQDLDKYVQTQLERAFSIAGLSRQSISGEIPSGLETGQAVRDHFDTSQVAFQPQLKRYGDFVGRVAEKAIAVGRQIWELDKSFSAVLPRDKNTIEEVDWSKVSLDPRKDSYTIKVMPSSSLPQTPAGRLAFVTDLINTGLIKDEGQMWELLDFPDAQEAVSLAKSGSVNLDRMFEEMLDEGKYTPPSPFMDIPLAIKKAHEQEQRAEARGVPEDRLLLLRLFLRQSHDQLMKQQEATFARQVGMQQAAAGPPAIDETGQAPTALTGEEL